MPRATLVTWTACSLFLAAILFGGRALASDWRYAGAFDKDRASAHAFYDANSITYPKRSIVRAWVRTISQSVIDDFTKAHEQIVVEKSATRLRESYIPPFLNLPSAKKKYLESEIPDITLDLISYEVVANEPGVQDINKLYFEIDCSGARIRTLTGITYSPNGTANQQSPKREPEFQSIVPDSNAQKLSELVCPNHD